METHETTPADIRFVGEQDGPPERDLKKRISSLLERAPAVERAYLARVEYTKPPGKAVVLCIRSDEDLSLVKAIQGAFASMFGRDVSLDILFVDAAQEAEVARVCRPFFEAKPRPADGDGK
jgi:hypothetical protein